MATELNRLQLNQEFRDGERPSGDDFASAWLSFINKTDDGVKIDTHGNVEVNRGLKLKDATTGDAGTLRFNGGNVQYHDGTTFKNIASGVVGAFLPVGAGPHVAFGGGNVGIGNFPAASPPTHKLEIVLGANSALDQRVKFGNLIVHNGAAVTGAYISHTNQGGDTSFALFQDNNGNTTLNAANLRQLTISQNNAARITITTAGELTLTPASSVTIRGDVAIGIPATPEDLFVTGNLTVIGTASKTGGGPFVAISDKRLKKDIRPHNDGLAKLIALKPVAYKYNGKGGIAEDNKEYIGLVAQEVEAVFPEIIIRKHARLNEDDKEETEILAFDPGPLTYSIINALSELSSRIEKLEKSQSHGKGKPKSSPGINN